MFQEGFHTKVGEGRTKKYRCQISPAYLLQIKICTGTIQQFNFFQKLLLLFRDYQLIQTCIFYINFFDLPFPGTFLGIGKGQYFSGFSVINTTEFLTGTNRPVYRTGSNAQFLFNLIQKIKGIICITVHFVNKSENWNMTHHTDLKQLSCLCFYTFGSINDHYRRVCCHQSTVSIL